jgi:hypothetical protein
MKKNTRVENEAMIWGRKRSRRRGGKEPFEFCMNKYFILFSPLTVHKK